MKTEIRNSIFAGLTFGILIMPVIAIFYNFPTTLMVGLAAGFAFGFAMYSFMNSKTIEQETSLSLNESQSIIYSGAANHFLGAEAVGGKLYLLADKLQFKSHSFNIQNHEMIIDLGRVGEIGFYRSLGLVPNGLSITTTDGEIEKFVVNNRNTWKEKIEELKDKAISF